MLKLQCPFELLLPDSCFILHPTTSRSNVTTHKDIHILSLWPSAPFCATLARWLWQWAYQQLVWHLLDKCNRLLNKTLPLSEAAFWLAPLLSLPVTHTYIPQHKHIVLAKPACWAAMKTYMQMHRGEHRHTQTHTQRYTTLTHTQKQFYTQHTHSPYTHMIKHYLVGELIISDLH